MQGTTETEAHEAQCPSCGTEEPMKRDTDAYGPFYVCACEYSERVKTEDLLYARS